MEGSKIKNIVIIILLLLNGFLLILSGSRRLGDTQSRDRARTGAMDVIRASGVVLEDSAVPRNMELQPMRADRDMERERAIAQALLGENLIREHRGSEVYRYENTAGSIQFHSTGEFSARFEHGDFTLEELDPGSHAAAVAARLDCTAELLYSTVTAGTGTVTLMQVLDGVPVLECRITAQYEQGELTGLRGMRLPGQTRQLSGESPVSVATALMRLYNGLKEMGDVYSRIETIRQGYSMAVERSGSVLLTPVWVVHTDTGDYLLDTMTGQLARAAGASAAAEQIEP